MTSRAGNHSRIASVLTMDEALIPCQLFKGGAVVIYHPAEIVFRLEIGQNPLRIPTRTERDGAGGLSVTNEVQVVIDEPQDRKEVAVSALTTTYQTTG